jgi:transcriptional regulator with XRE-family HTH domain
MVKYMNRIPELMQRKGLRDNKRYSQKDMVEGTGLTSGAVSRIVNNRTLDHVPLSSAVPIARWLGVHVEELVKEVDDDADIP